MVSGPALQPRPRAAVAIKEAATANLAEKDLFPPTNPSRNNTVEPPIPQGEHPRKFNIPLAERELGCKDFPGAPKCALYGIQRIRSGKLEKIRHLSLLGIEVGRQKRPCRLTVAPAAILALVDCNQL
jgi:hypothetical protein